MLESFDFSKEGHIAYTVNSQSLEAAKKKLIRWVNEIDEKALLQEVERWSPQTIDRISRAIFKIKKVRYDASK